ncbi:hypothetical protein LX64_02672 [Chitinophaga skermanii]|uniref:Immunity protein 44 of polymorphic toxin system n=1 Tax=Chitinophaga skermanii TaxID=331697 RepID=A0A327QPD6_9BACT|nr:hypothetical protein [Chitinophaga skermanii]RAJ05512.1 hypothetical protein LX64_02672 [Chitinophaga skermanii]
MEKYFSIIQLGRLNLRPEISYKVREYLENFFIKKVFEAKKIIVGGKWMVEFCIHFLPKGPGTLFEDIVLAKGARTVSSDSLKIYECIIPFDFIRDADDPKLETIKLMFRAIKLFVTSTYKKVKPEVIDELWNEIDLNYLLSLPYPAPIDEQKYFVDEIMNNQQ